MKKIISALALALVLGFTGVTTTQAQIVGIPLTPATFTRDLTLSARGNDVTALQNFLISKGYNIGGAATGYFGLQTKAALAAYQVSKGISPADGYFGPITRASVNAEIKSRTTVIQPGYPLGCTSGTGYSSVTGLPCSIIATSSAQLTLSASPSPIPSGTIIINPYDTVNAQFVNFNVKSEGGDAKITDVSVFINASGTIPTTLYLYSGTSLISSRTVPGGYSSINTTVTFSNLNYIVANNTMQTLTVKGDFPANGNAGSVASVNVNSVTYQRANGTSVTTTNGAVIGSPQYFFKAAPQINLSTAPTATASNNTNGQTTSITGIFPMTIQALGGTMVQPVGSDFVVKYGISSPLQYTASNISVTTNPNGNIAEGSTASVTVTANVPASAIPMSGLYTFSIESIKYKVGTVSGTQNYGLENFKTPNAVMAVVGSTTPSEETNVSSCPSSIPTFTTNLAFGDQNDPVHNLKCFLNSKGYLLGNYLNSYYGNYTKAALAAYQTSKGISPNDGVYFGPITRAAVNADIASTQSSGFKLSATMATDGSVHVNDSFDPNKYEPIFINLKATCPYGVSGTFASPSNVGEACNTTVRMSPIAGPGAYQTVYNFTNSTNSNQTVNFQADPNGVISQNSASAGIDIAPTKVGGIRIDSPNGGETWTKGTTQTIKWRDTSAGFVATYYDIRLVPISPTCPPGAYCAIPAPYLIVGGATGSSYDWRVGLTKGDVTAPDGAYNLQICQTGTNTCDTTDSYFKISGQTISVNLNNPANSYTLKANGTISVQFWWYSTTPNGYPYAYLLKSDQDNSNPAGGAYSSIDLISYKNQTSGTGGEFNNVFRTIVPGQYKVVVCDQTTDIRVPTCGASNIFTVGPNQTAAGDLVVDSFSWTPVTPTVGQTDPYLYFTASVKNIGTGIVFVPSNTEFSVTNNGTTVGRLTIGTGSYFLSPNETKALTFSSVQSPSILSQEGQTSLVMTADSNNLVSESNENNNSLTKQITINSPTPTLSISTDSLISGTVGGKYSALVEGAGGATTYEWSIIKGSLPAGIAITSSRCRQLPCQLPFELNGTPTAGGTYPITLQLKSGNSVTTKDFSIVIGGGQQAVTIISPNGGEILKRGTYQNIKWNLNSINQYKVDLSLIPQVMSTQNYGIYNTNTGESSYSWNVGQSSLNQNIPDGQYRLRVVVYSDASQQYAQADMSDGFFTISSPTQSEETDLQSCSVPVYTFSTNLALGDSNYDVLRLKCFLNSKGYLAANYLNTYFGDRTKTALMQYQVAKGIAPADGSFGSITRASVNAAMNVTPGQSSYKSDFQNNNSAAVTNAINWLINWMNGVKQ